MKGDAFVRTYRIALGVALIGVLWGIRDHVADVVRFVLSLHAS